MYSSHLIVVVVGFVDTLVEVNETDGQATLNVSISSPQPMLGLAGFDLLVDSMDGSAGRNFSKLRFFMNYVHSLPCRFSLLLTNYTWKQI